MWQAPEAYVFSHPDGIQGVALPGDGGDWSFQGIVDVEDHHFTDPRFALAGYDLAHGSPETFRRAYVSETTWPEGFAQCRPVFHVYFLATWVTVLERVDGAAGLCSAIEDRLAALAEAE